VRTRESARTSLAYELLFNYCKIYANQVLQLNAGKCMGHRVSSKMQVPLAKAVEGPLPPLGSHQFESVPSPLAYCRR
jgi:hypothetical protein